MTRSAVAQACGFTLMAASAGPVLAQEAQATTVERFEGIARSQDGALVYRERHRVEYEAGRPIRSLTAYFDPAGKKIAELRSDYRASSFAPRYTFVDADGRTREAAGLLPGGVELQRERERKVLEPGPAQMQVVLGQGLHQLVRSKLDELARGAGLVVRFGIPSRLEAYPFRIEREESPDPRLVRLRIRIDNWLLALLAPSLEVDYEQATRRLMRYGGVSNLPGPDGDPMKVVIRYVYQDDERLAGGGAP